MTGKEIVLKALNFEETPRLPVCILDGYVWALKRGNKSFQDLFEMEDGGAEFMIQAYEDLQSDLVYPNCHAFNQIMKVMGGDTSMDRPGEAAEVTVRPLKSIEDVKNFDVNEVIEKLFETPEFKSNLTLTKILEEKMGQERLVSALTIAPFSMAGMLVGVQTFMEEIMDDEDDTQALLDFATEAVARICEEEVKYGAEAIFIADPVASGELISPSFFEEFALPSLNKLCDRLKKLNVPILLHICGNTTKRLEPLVGTAINGFSMDNVDLKTGLDIARGHYTIIGNLSPFDVMLNLTADEVYDIALERGKIAGKSGGYIMMPGCDLPPMTPLENVQAMVRAAKEA